MDVSINEVQNEAFGIDANKLSNPFGNLKR